MDDMILQSYRKRKELFTRKLSVIRKHGNLLSFSRLLIFLTGIILIYFTAGISPVIPVMLVFLTGIVFLILVKKHGRKNNQISHLNELIRLNENEILGLEGDISHFNSGSEFFDTNHPYSYDLDLFGEGSLFQYLNRTCSEDGEKILAKWLLNPFEDRTKIGEMQDAVRELKSKLDWRQDFLASGNLYVESSEEKDRILSWLKMDHLFHGRKRYHIIRIVFPVITVSFLIFSVLSLIPASFAIAMFLIQLLITAIFLSPVNRIHQQVTKRFNILEKFGKLLSSIENEKFTSSLLSNYQEILIRNGLNASEHIHALARIINHFDRRLDMIMGVLLNGLLLWDLHCVTSLEKWKKRSSGSIPDWFTVISEVDALISFAGFSYNNPEYIYPEIIEEGAILTSTRLGHPLIDKKQRVPNDLQIDRKGFLVIITGPNMAGKSTFLRTVGVNLILAMTGLPVCAESFRFTPMKLYSSMRTSDSLQKNESYFYAELRRLKVLKEKLQKQERIIILLDEILKGTNSLDKHQGSKLFIEQLIQLNGVGLIATHDVALGEMETLFPDHIVNKCFEVEINGDKIMFDYILRDGITRKMNAALLMKQMGIA